MTGHGRRWERYAATRGSGPDVAAEGRDHGVVDGLAPVRAMGVVGLGRVGWRLALPPLIELGGACRAPLRIKHPVDGLRIEGPSFGTRLLELILGLPHGAGQLKTASA